MKLSGWGRFPIADCAISFPSDEVAVRRLVAGGNGIARGNGRAYGDSALNRDLTIGMSRFNRMIAFDAEAGVLTVEAGVILGDIIEAFLPRGWFPSVTPGTKFVSVGGMIAADVHGKNHHKHGSFGAFVEWIDLMVADGRVVRCSRTDNPDLFAATVGGMGLTGVILRAAIRLTPVESAWIRQLTIPASSLDEAMAVFERSADWTYSVAWIDCLARGRDLGRSLIMLGEHASQADLDARRRLAPYDVAAKRKRRIPIDIPNFVLNRLSVSAFNAAYYATGRSRAGRSLVDWDSYFYPLDSVLEWNRIYGRRGFAQYQCVLPLASSRDGMAELLKAISASGQGSFLAVLKRMGPQNSLFSFPMEGYTLALDFPVSAANLALMDRLDAITIAHGGRFYLAKDSRMSADVLEKADARVAAFRAAREADGAIDRFTSLQSQRLRL
jgi:FAD/FMN-containing dehydrogenase